jgi:hypothetical protein
MATMDPRKRWKLQTKDWDTKVFSLDRISNPRQQIPAELTTAKKKVVSYLNPQDAPDVLTEIEVNQSWIDKWEEGDWNWNPTGERKGPSQWWFVDVDNEGPVLVNPWVFKKANITQKARIRSLPSFLTLANVYPGEYGDVEKVVAQREQRRAEGKPGALDECQADAISPSIAKQMEGYYRVGLFPDAPIQNRPKPGPEKQRSQKAKRKAEAYKRTIQEKIQAEGGAEIAIRVRKLNCQDATPPGFYWTVWINTPREEDAVRFQNIETGQVVGGLLRGTDEERRARRQMQKKGEKASYTKTKVKKRRGGQMIAGGTGEGTAEGSTQGYAIGVPRVQAARPGARVHETCPVCKAPALSDLKPRDQKLWSKPQAPATGVGCRSGWEYPEDWEPTEMIDRAGKQVRVRTKPGGKPTNPHLPRVNKYIERVGLDNAVTESAKYRRTY